MNSPKNNLNKSKTVSPNSPKKFDFDESSPSGATC